MDSAQRIRETAKAQVNFVVKHYLSQFHRHLIPCANL